MSSAYYSKNGEIGYKIPSTPDFIKRLIYALCDRSAVVEEEQFLAKKDKSSNRDFVTSLGETLNDLFQAYFPSAEQKAAREESSARTRNDIKAVFQIVEKMPCVDYATLSPSGELLLGDASHLNPEYRGTPEFSVYRQNTNFNWRKIDLEQMLIGNPLLPLADASSSHAWVPIMPVRENRAAKQLSHQSLPALLVFYEDFYYPAQYHPGTATFQPQKERELAVLGEQLTLLDIPRIIHDYDRPKTEDESNTGGLSRRVFVSATGDKNFLRGNSKKKCRPPSAKEVCKEWFTTVEEVQQIVQEIITSEEESNERGSMEDYVQLGKLHRFLLYKAFLETIALQGHYIVGQITGDSYTIHMPYISVGLRE